MSILTTKFNRINKKKKRLLCIKLFTNLKKKKTLKRKEKPII